MPILEVEIVAAAGLEEREALAQRIADSAAEALDSSPQSTWVRVRMLPSTDYAENGGAEAGIGPVFVSIIKRANPEGEALAAEVQKLTQALALACGRPAENVHIRYEPPAAGRQAFGGKLV